MTVVPLNATPRSEKSTYKGIEYLIRFRPGAPTEEQWECIVTIVERNQYPFLAKTSMSAVKKAQRFIDEYKGR